MTVQQFESEHNGQLVKSPHGFAGQCVSVSSQWAVENSWPELVGAGDDTAYHIWVNGVGGYQKISNTTNNYPVAGDIVFWGPVYGDGTGHTGVCVSANVSSMRIFEQNDPYHSGAHEQGYNYHGVLGWFRHAGNPTPAPGPSGVTPISRDVRITSTLNVRTAPSTSAPLAINSSIPNGTLTAGTVIHVIGQIHAQSVAGNDLWYETVHGNYIWSGGAA